MNDMSDIPQDLLTQSIAGRRLDNKCIILTVLQAQLVALSRANFSEKVHVSCSLVEIKANSMISWVIWLARALRKPSW